MKDGTYFHNGLHLTKDDRKAIAQALIDKAKLKDIASLIGKDERTIAKEIKLHRHRKDNGKNLWANSVKRDVFDCKRIRRFPFTCHGCFKVHKSCLLDHFFYDYDIAHEQYLKTLSSARIGIDLDEVSYQELDRIIYEGVKKGQSISHVINTHAEVIPVSPRTVYRYIDQQLMSTIPLDMRRKVRLRPRHKKEKMSFCEHDYLIGRDIVHFGLYMLDHPGLLYCQMDTVIGLRDESSCFLTLHWPYAHFMLAFKLNSKTTNSVSFKLNQLYEKLGDTKFRMLFSCILTDRGSEFKDPLAIEFISPSGVKRSNLFYCSPQASHQKGELEKNHELIRYVIPKGISLKAYDQDDLDLLMGNINSYAREGLGWSTPYSIFAQLYGLHTLTLLNIVLVTPEKIVLNPSLLK
jgi:transposase, IS30 family